MGLEARVDGGYERMLAGIVRQLRDEATTAVAEETKAIERDLKGRAPTRALSASVRSEITGRFGRTGRVHVGENVRPYVAGYEYGSIRLAKAPFIRPTALNAEDRFLARARSRLGRVR